VIPEPAATVIRRFVARLDGALPGVIDGFYVVGSIALGAFRPGRSDIACGDAAAAAVAGRDPRPAGGAPALMRRRSRPPDHDTAADLALVCNGVFVRHEDLAAPPGLAAPVASQVAGRFDVGSGFDLNPVTWWTLAHRGIAVRGPAGAR
jgi:hypothetical protein